MVQASWLRLRGQWLRGGNPRKRGKGKPSASDSSDWAAIMETTFQSSITAVKGGWVRWQLDAAKGKRAPKQPNGRGSKDGSGERVTVQQQPPTPALSALPQGESTGGAPSAAWGWGVWPWSGRQQPPPPPQTAAAEGADAITAGTPGAESLTASAARPEPPSANVADASPAASPRWRERATSSAAAGPLGSFGGWFASLLRPTQADDEADEKAVAADDRTKSEPGAGQAQQQAKAPEGEATAPGSFSAEDGDHTVVDVKYHDLPPLGSE